MTASEVAMAATPTRLRYHPSLDGLRAIAVTLVVLYHAGATSGLPGLAPGGFIGVSVFFTISGYLVTTILLREGAPDGRIGAIDFGRFWARRVKRLWPASLCVVAVAVVLSSWAWSGMIAPDAFAGVYGYTNWYVIWSGADELLRTIVGPLGPFWSLAIEEQFYLLLTVTVLLCWRTRNPIRWLTVAVVAGWFGSLAAQLLISGPQYRLEFGTDTRGGEILAGCGLAILLHHRPELLDRWRRWAAPAGAVALAAIIVLALTNDYDPPWLLRGGYSALSLFSAVLVLALLVPNRLTSTLGWRPLAAVGIASYSIYLVHWPVILVLTPARTGMSTWGLVALKIMVAGIVAAGLHLVVEQPVRRALVRNRTVAVGWLAATAAVSGLAILVL
ncbi:MAG: acyltransferase [Ilumatobacteraceae bacterium]